MQNDFFELIEEENSSVTLRCRGSWVLENIRGLEHFVRDIDTTALKDREIVIDFGSVDEFDTSGVIILLELKEKLDSLGSTIKLELSDREQKIISIIDLIDIKNGFADEKKREGFFYRIGRASVDKLHLFREFFEFVGIFFVSWFRLFTSPKDFRVKETIYHIEKSGFNALFIIALTSILVGLVVAYQSIVQLAQFGADIFVVDAIGISITRELGPMISAIVIAGRSASSYTAEIGTMKLTEEINAMKTMGFDPYLFLVIPRVIALMVSLPLVIFFSDITGILGGMLATKAQGDISFYFFINRLQEVLEIKHYLLGLIKGPFFAMLIALTGCFHGFRVTSDTESIGIETTASVVHAIFLVIACDAIFSIIYTELGL